jgi:hypothetical protein
MPWSTRTFIRSNAGEVKRISHASFERLWNGDERESWLDHAGEFVHVAIVYVERDEDHAAVRKIEYMRLKLGTDGRLDEEWRRQGMSLAVGCLDPVLTPREPSSKVVRAGHHFARRRYRSEHAWKPTRAQEEAIVRGALDRLPRSRSR